jgi:prepilin peptidase CpaA
VGLDEVFAVGAATLAALVDVRSRRIPNWLTGGALLVGVGLNLWLRGASGLPFALLGALLGGAILLPFYALRVMGAGDVKLLAALGAVVGPQALIMVVLYAVVVGGVISVVRLALHRRLAMSFFDVVRRPTQMRLSGVKAPYGVAIASGVYLSLLLRGAPG